MTPEQIKEMLEEKKRAVAKLLEQKILQTNPLPSTATPAPTLTTIPTPSTPLRNPTALMNPGLLSAIEKAKSAAQEQNMRIGPLVGMKFGATDKKKTITLKLDALGRPVDEQGNVIGLPNKEVISSLKVNQRMNKGKLKIEKPVLETDPERNPHYDPNIKIGNKHKERQAFSFHEPGTFLKLGQQVRAKNQLMKLQKELEEKAKKAGIDALVDLSGAVQPKLPEVPKIPEVEWWDSFFLQDFSYDGIETENGIKNDLITHLVQHPVPVKPHGYKEDTPPRDLILTPKERKKLRRQRRLEIRKEQQEKIALGLLPPPPPKVKMSNFMKVLGNEAIQDPTKMEKFARQQVEKRLQDHLAANEARKLTPQEKKEKLKAKLQKDAQENGIHVAVFRVRDLSHPQHKFKVDATAQSLTLTGCAILYKNMNLVIVEGGPRAIRKYKKLMLHRIKWNEQAPDGNSSNANGNAAGDHGGKEEDNEDDEDDEDDEDNSKHSKSLAQITDCALVWEGIVKKPALKGFRFKQCATELLIINYLEKFGVPQYWDFAKNFVFET
jgi:U4/U6 small nuclear ribonucleoprotein PRP3